MMRLPWAVLLLNLAVILEVCAGALVYKRISSEVVAGSDLEAGAGSSGPPHVTGDGIKVAFVHEADFGDLPGNRAGFGNNIKHVWLAPADGGGGSTSNYVLLSDSTWPTVDGLKWVKVGETAPSGQALDCSKLAKALVNTTTFTKEEWEVFGITDLRTNHFIKSGDFQGHQPNTYFQPDTPREDSQHVSIDRTGANAVFDTTASGEESIVKWSAVNGGTRKYITGPLSVSGHDAKYPQISADGTTIVFQSDAEFVSAGSCEDPTTQAITCNMAAEHCSAPRIHRPPGYVGSDGCCHCVTSCDHTKETGTGCSSARPPRKSNYDQIYITKDDGATFNMVTPATLTESTKAKGPHVSGDGSLVSFQAKMNPPAGTFHAANPTISDKEEAWLYHVPSQKLAKISNLAGKQCRKDQGASGL